VKRVLKLKAAANGDGAQKEYCNSVLFLGMGDASAVVTCQFTLL
jgi:hypothetical protein